MSDPIGSRPWQPSPGGLEIGNGFSAFEGLTYMQVCEVLTYPQLPKRQATILSKILQGKRHVHQLERGDWDVLDAAFRDSRRHFEQASLPPNNLWSNE